jgi:LPXTG-motif cell wall-anchored protein
MPARLRIAASIAALALAAPPAAAAQSGGGGAGDSQYQDPFGSTTPATPAKPSQSTAPAQQQPAQGSPPAQQQAPPQPTPGHDDGDAATTAPTAQAQAPPAAGDPAATLPRTGFDVLPVAVAGLALLLGGLALWRRPHADR